MKFLLDDQVIYYRIFIKIVNRKVEQYFKNRILIELKILNNHYKNKLLNQNKRVFKIEKKLI
jgi:hypothetical protein